MSHNKTEWRGHWAAGPLGHGLSQLLLGDMEPLETKWQAAANQHCVDIVTGQTATAILRAWHSAYTTKGIPHNR